MVSRVFDGFFSQDQRQQHVARCDRDAVNADDEQRDPKYQPVHYTLIGVDICVKLRVPYEKSQDAQENADAEEEIAPPRRAEHFLLILLLHIEKSADGHPPHFPSHVQEDEKARARKIEDEHSRRSGIKSNEDHFRDSEGADDDHGDDLADYEPCGERQRQSKETQEEDLQEEHPDHLPAPDTEQEIHAELPAPFCEHELCRIVDEKADHKEDNDIDKIKDHLEGVHPLRQAAYGVRRGDQPEGEHQREGERDRDQADRVVAQAPFSISKGKLIQHFPCHLPAESGCPGSQ